MPIASGLVQNRAVYSSFASKYEDFVVKVTNDPSIRENSMELWTIGAFAGAGAAAGTLAEPGGGTLAGAVIGAKVGDTAISAIHTLGTINDCLQWNDRCGPGVGRKATDTTLEFLFKTANLAKPPGVTQAAELAGAGTGHALSAFFDQ